MILLVLTLDLIWRYTRFDGWFSQIAILLELMMILKCFYGDFVIDLVIINKPFDLLNVLNYTFAPTLILNY